MKTHFLTRLGIAPLRTLASAAIAIAGIALANPSLAGAPVSGQRAAVERECTELQHQFDVVSQRRQGHPDYPAARDLRDQGAALCVAQDDVAGALKLKQALTKLGVKPSHLRPAD